jgi:hypothetical protein
MVTQFTVEVFLSDPNSGTFAFNATAIFDLISKLKQSLDLGFESILASACWWTSVILFVQVRDTEFLNLGKNSSGNYLWFVMFDAIALDTFDFIDNFSWHSCVIEV